MNRQRYRRHARIPASRRRWLELRAPFEFSALGLFSPLLLSAPRGDGRPVLLLPGFMAGGGSLMPLRTYLRWLSYDAEEWGLGINRGGVERYVSQLGETIKRRYARAPVTLIGWSLGGVISRELARLHEPLVREVITMGSPIAGGQSGIRVPVTSIYSRTDAIVPYEASIDRTNRQARNVEIDSSHIGMGVNPMVWLEIARALGTAAQEKS